MVRTQYPSESLQLWEKAKELRTKFYKDFEEAKKRGGLRWMGSGWAFDSVPKGLGEDLYCLPGEIYGANCAFEPSLSKKFLKSTSDYGFAPDLCAYMRNYWGSILCNEYALGNGDFPEADFAWTQHICCSQAKWYQNASELQAGEAPLFAVDVGVGPYFPFQPEMYEQRLRYVVDQLLDGIEWLQKITGREFKDDLFIKAAWNEIYSCNKWAEICQLNQAIPSPLDEKTIHSLYLFGSLQKSHEDWTNFFDELYEEVKDRVDRGIAAVANEEKRILTDNLSPWGIMKIYDHMERWGAACVGSLTSFGLNGGWLYDNKNHDLYPRPLPEDKPNNRLEACRMLADWQLSKPVYQQFYNPEYKTKMIDALAKNWDIDGIILHYNRGCEGLSVGIAENRLGLLELKNKVMVYEGNMGDETEFDESATLKRLDIFLENLGLERP